MLSIPGQNARKTKRNGISGGIRKQSNPSFLWPLLFPSIFPFLTNIFPRFWQSIHLPTKTNGLQLITWERKPQNSRPRKRKAYILTSSTPRLSREFAFASPSSSVKKRKLPQHCQSLSISPHCAVWRSQGMPRQRPRNDAPLPMNWRKCREQSLSRLLTNSFTEERGK